MEFFETDLDNNEYFDEFALALSDSLDESVVISEDYINNDVELYLDVLSSSDLIVNMGDMFKNNFMNEHLATIELLGNLGYTDMLIYYCVVMDSLFIKSEMENNENLDDIMTPEQYINEKDTNDSKVFFFEVYVSKSKFKKFIKVLNYFKAKEFKVLSNTFYMDGSDFILFLTLKSVVGYNLRLKIVFKCNSVNDTITLEETFRLLQQKLTVGEDNE